MEDIPILDSTKDSTSVERDSTALAGKQYLSVRDGGVYLPIAWREIESATCENGAEAPKYVLSLGSALGQDYPVQVCDYHEYEYLAPTFHETELRALPAIQGGDGTLFYEERIDQQRFVNANNGSLGQYNTTRLLKGLDYVKGTKVLTGEKASVKI